MKNLQCCERSKTVTVFEVAIELNMSVQAVHQYLKRHKVQPACCDGGRHPNTYYCLDVRNAYGDWHPRHKWSS